MFRIGLQGFHFKNKEDFFSLTEEEASAIEAPKVLVTNTVDVLDEHLSQQELVVCPSDLRWVTIEE